MNIFINIRLENSTTEKIFEKQSRKILKITVNFNEIKN